MCRLRVVASPSLPFEMPGYKSFPLSSDHGMIREAKAGVVSNFDHDICDLTITIKAFMRFWKIWAFNFTTCLRESPSSDSGPTPYDALVFVKVSLAIWESIWKSRIKRKVKIAGSPPADDVITRGIIIRSITIDKWFFLAVHGIQPFRIATESLIRVQFAILALALHFLFAAPPASSCQKICPGLQILSVILI